MAEDIIFQSAVDTLQRGDKTAAKILLARLLKMNPKNVKYWLWMSAAVETRDEQVYCLQMVHKLDPENAIAKRGLTSLGALPGAQTVQTHTSQQVSADTIFQNAVKAIQEGNRSIAKDLLAHLLKKDGNNVKYWLWMSAAVESPNEQIFCLQAALKLDPENTAAKRGLNQLGMFPVKEAVQPVQQFSSRVWKEDPLLSPVKLKPTEEKTFSSKKYSLQKINWALTLGSLLVTFMILLAVFGPSIAPQNPMKENYSLSANGKIHTPPYKPMEVPGYILGTDRFGRDLWSRILWGVRPTMIMVISVAGVRLLLGILIGLITGWSEGRRGHALESLVSTALSIPVLIAALIGIYSVGIDKGLTAFIVGLGMTGWAETARMVSERTRAIKSQTFVEAARALGASDRRVLYVHVLSQIMSLLWMLLAFEVSSTLLVSAELGFLGYYIGGGIWIEISDFVAVNAEGLPELGQMLASSLVKITDPSTLLVVGGVICMGVLGFNLLGEGLRLQMSQERTRGGHRFGFLPASLEEWLEVRVLQPASIWMEVNRRLVWSLVVLIIFAVAGWTVYKTIYFRPLVPETTQFENPGENLWAGERHDSFGTLWVPLSMDAEPQLLWNVPIPGGPSGRPAVNKDGTIIVGALDKSVLALDPNGKILWQTQLDEAPVGTPALDAEGRIFVAGNKGGVIAIDPNGTILWRAQASNGRGATSGPVIDTKGNIFLTIIDEVAAVSPQGQLIWRANAADVYLEEAPRISADQSMVFLKNSAFKAATGERVLVTIGTPQDYLFSDPTYFTGADGNNYYRLGHEIIGWRLNGENLETDKGITWQYDSFVLFTPAEQGVTPNKLYWMYYATSYSDGRMVWLDDQSRVVGNVRFPYTNAKLIAVGQKDEAYICSSTGASVICINIPPGTETPTWEFTIENAPAVILGGAFVPDRIYLSLDKDGLYAIGTNRP